MELELGHLLFGNPRGDFRFPRSGELADAFWDFLRTAGLSGYGFPEGETGKRLEKLMKVCTNGYALENDHFVIRPYDWDPVCTCGFEDKETEWSNSNQHEQSCYQTVLAARQRVIIASYGVDELYKITHQSTYKKAYDRCQSALYQVCQEFNLPREGCMVHCTCSYQSRSHEFYSANEHADNCRQLQPNFLHKKTGFELNWYKYALRDATTNVEVTIEQLEAILADCLASLGVTDMAD